MIEESQSRSFGTTCFFNKQMSFSTYLAFYLVVFSVLWLPLVFIIILPILTYTFYISENKVWYTYAKIFGVINLMFVSLALVAFWVLFVLWIIFVCQESHYLYDYWTLNWIITEKIKISLYLVILVFLPFLFLFMVALNFLTQIKKEHE